MHTRMQTNAYMYLAFFGMHAFGPNTVMHMQAKDCMQNRVLACMQHVKIFVRVFALAIADNNK